MSAKTELLIEKMRKLDQQIAELQASGQDASAQIAERSALSKDWNTSTSALQEGKKILKG